MRSRALVGLTIVFCRRPTAANPDLQIIPVRGKRNLRRAHRPWLNLPYLLWCVRQQTPPLQQAPPLQQSLLEVANEAPSISARAVKTIAIRFMKVLLG